MSAADLMAVLMVNHFRYDWDNPENPFNDRYAIDTTEHLGIDRCDIPG